MMSELRTTFIKEAIWHGSPDEAEKLLAAHPELADSDIHTAAIVGNVQAVRRFLKEDPENAKLLSEPFGGNALVYLCMSKYLRLDKKRSDDFMQAATALLDAGADPDSGFWTTGRCPEFETALYGAAGVANHAGLTTLLLERGADPNDGEAVYHSPEFYENDAMKALVETGKVRPENLSLMLIRKHDLHDYEGIKYLLEHGTDPNYPWNRGWYAIHHALARSNGPSIIALLLEHGADPSVMNDGLTAIARAAREGRNDVLELFQQKGITINLDGVDRLIATCAMADTGTVQSILQQSPSLLKELLAMGGELLARFSLSNNKQGVLQLLELGVDVNTPYQSGDDYFGIPRGSLAIHVAAWLGNPAVVQLLIERGSHVDLPDKNGQTPLALAIRACVDSYWTYRRSPDSVKALLDAGASTKNIPYPTGYAAIDELLRK